VKMDNCLILFVLCFRTTVSCRVGEFRCDDSTCIPDSLKCDNRRDCSRGEDELNCRGKLKKDFNSVPSDRIFRSISDSGSYLQSYIVRDVIVLDITQ
jgi:hypothetical protein